MQELFSALSLWLSAHPLITGWYTAIARLLFPVLSALILVRAIRSLLRIPHTPEVWAQLSLPGGGSIPLTHWENILGRGKSADAILNYPSISRQHAALCRGEDGAWTVYDLGSKGGTAVNGKAVADKLVGDLGVQRDGDLTLRRGVVGGGRFRRIGRGFLTDAGHVAEFLLDPIDRVCSGAAAQSPCQQRGGQNEAERSSNAFHYHVPHGLTGS